ncbi:ATP-binding domain-containing protein [Lacrimispora sp. 38-1]|uniref:ATP-binding domain-containing protein n=1 Tax=Lacrimispora sp. 38-1 TaxID=3125778 RepID=UPI003CE6ACF6
MAKHLYHSLQELEGVHLLDFNSTEFKEGVIITSSHMSKGLEFDQVLIPNVSDEEYKSEMDRKMLYVACTRAMHKLALTYVGEKTKWLKNIITRRIYEQN